MSAAEVEECDAEDSPPPGYGQGWEAGERSISRRAYPSRKGFRLTLFPAGSMRDIANLSGCVQGTTAPGCYLLCTSAQGRSWEQSLAKRKKP